MKYIDSQDTLYELESYNLIEPSTVTVKAEKTADLNGDGVVNILDLVILSNAFGKDSPDLNADGVVNILDLVVISNAFD
ncbi:MAG: dockerin type I domain-containing protein [Candidatus Poribacteria bacterium]|nr:dockerin type I domain-containing protein [Candidatus Poribacteria bacterium]